MVWFVWFVCLCVCLFVCLLACLLACLLVSFMCFACFSCLFLLCVLHVFLVCFLLLLAFSRANPQASQGKQPVPRRAAPPNPRAALAAQTLNPEFSTSSPDLREVLLEHLPLRLQLPQPALILPADAAVLLAWGGVAAALCTVRSALCGWGQRKRADPQKRMGRRFIGVCNQTPRPERECRDNSPYPPPKPLPAAS